MRWLLVAFLAIAACAACSQNQSSAPVDGGAACFDTTGQLMSALQQCQATTDCVIISHSTTCCGDPTLMGLNKASVDQLSICEQQTSCAAPCDPPLPGSDAGTLVAVCGNGGICVVNYQ